METRLQRRIQRYGWDLAASAYETLWRAHISEAQAKLLACAAILPGERVLDVACGTGMVSHAAARAVGPGGEVLGVDLSGRMVEVARGRADSRRLANIRFERMDAERLTLPGAHFDVVLCALGLMYVPRPELAMAEMRRVMRPGARFAALVWGERSRCGWADVFSIVDAEVQSEVCPLFFRLGQGEALARLCTEAGFEVTALHRLSSTLDHADEVDACNAVFVGGPVALAWSRFDEPTRQRVQQRYLESIEPWRQGRGYRIPGEFVVVSATSPQTPKT
jgi:ubiquinone/menaquinone biosynthesis C-methylase UbiE